MFFKDDREEIDESLKKLVASNNQFALELYRRISQMEGNVFFSPYSISSALAMTYAGAREATREQMATALGFSSEEKWIHSGFKKLASIMNDAAEGSGLKLAIANALFPQDGYQLRRSYLNLVKRRYGTRITPVDYGEAEAARETINSWVVDATEGKIQDLIGAGVLDTLTRLVLVNAIYFKANWLHQFDEGQTHEQPFRPTSTTETPVQMMHQKASFGYAEDEQLQLIELPYRGKNVSMLILLPKEMDGIGQLEETLSGDSLENWTSLLEKTEVNLSLPKFELAFPFRLDEILQEMGMLDAFTGNADFSGIEESRELFLNAVLHKAFVEVNEKGTEAAAATAVIMQTKSVSFMSTDFVADHPFIFLIRENHSRSILFLGKFVKPAAPTS